MSKQMTPCEELGYKVGDKFEVLTDDDGFEIGSIVELWRDDDSICPLFRGKGGDGEYLEIYLNACQPENGVGVLDVKKVDETKKLKPAKQSLADAINQNGGWVECGDWHKNGELPPVGEVCEAYVGRPPKWIETEIVAHRGGFIIGWCNSLMKACEGNWVGGFRPLRTEREKAIDEMVSLVEPLATYREFAGAIYDAGMYKEVK